MAAPALILHTHVHSMRLASGAEALVARVTAAGGVRGFGFSFGMEAALARDMAAWDAHARSRGEPLWRALGRDGAPVPLAFDEEPAFRPDWEALRKAIRERRYRLLRIDPFAWGSLERVLTAGAAAAQAGIAVALVAPGAHPWELAWCASLAGPGTRIVVRRAPERSAIPETIRPSSAVGCGVDWASEPGFAGLQWLEPETAA